MRLKLGWDLDGVFDDFRINMGTWLMKVGRITPEEYELADQEIWSLSQAWDLTDEEFDRHFAEGVDAGWIFRQAQPAPGSVDVLHRLKEKGDVHHFATARLIGSRFAHNTMDWLHEHDFPYDSITFSHDKSILTGLDLLTDDHPRNYEECTVAGMRVVLLDQPWNRELVDAPRVTWETIEDYIDELAEELERT